MQMLANSLESRMIMTITYEVGNGLYINSTNRCSNACTFCVRATVESYYGDLWLKREPTVDEICESIFSVIFLSIPSWCSAAMASPLSALMIFWR